MNRSMAAVAAALSLVAAVPAAAQGPNFVVDGRSAQGRLEATDPDLGDGEHYDDYRVRLRADERVRLTLESEEFDPVLQVFRADDMHEPVAGNDDSGDSLNASVTFAAPADGLYTVRVLSYEAGTLGRYTLRGEQLPPLPPPVTAHSGTASTSWRVFRGELGGDDPDNEGRRFDDYLVTLRQGEQLLVRVDSDAIDPVVQILAADSRNGPELDADDDAGPGTGALLGFEAPQSGGYLVRVTSFAPDATGAYTLRIAH